LGANLEDKRGEGASILHLEGGQQNLPEKRKGKKGPQHKKGPWRKGGEQLLEKRYREKSIKNTPERRGGQGKA